MNVAARAYLARVYAIADELGSLRRRLPDDSYAHVLVRAIADNLETLDTLVYPSAAELVQAGRDVDEALRIVDERAHRLRRLAGDDPDELFGRYGPVPR